MKSLRFHALATAAALVAACAITTSPAALAATPAKAEMHDHGAAMPANLSLDHGRNWATVQQLWTLL